MTISRAFADKKDGWRNLPRPGLVKNSTNENIFSGNP
jgi:hypothetical protein